MSVLTYMHTETKIHFPDNSHRILEVIFIGFDWPAFCLVTASEPTTVAEG